MEFILAPSPLHLTTRKCLVYHLTKHYVISDQTRKETLNQPDTREPRRGRNFSLSYTMKLKSLKDHVSAEIL